MSCKLNGAGVSPTQVDSFPGGTKTSSTNIVVAVVIIVVVAIDVDVVIVRTNHPIAQALTDPPPFERCTRFSRLNLMRRGCGAVSYASQLWYRPIPTNKIPSWESPQNLPVARKWRLS